MKRLTLTFDNGPWADGATDDILDLLAARGILASFFVVANRLADPVVRAVAGRAKAEGHLIGNHTYAHRTPLGMMEDVDAAIEEVARAEAALGELAGQEKLFRPPGKGRLGRHLLNQGVADYLARERYTVVTWNNVPRDWEDTTGEWVDRALDTAASQDWSLLVVHDHHLRRLDGSLQRFLDRAEASGVEFVQEFPEDCTPMIKGRASAALADCVT